MDQINRHILFCNCKGDRISADKLNDIREYLEKVPFRVTILSDLCGLAAIKRDQLKKLTGESAEILMIGCYPRTMNLLFGQASGSGVTGKSLSYLNMIESTAGEVIKEVNLFCSTGPGNKLINEINEDSGWPSWYPVIDYERCTGCGQCADFCLFGVYEKTHKRVIVINPGGCKNQCPACARICPSTDIIFQKYKNGGAIGGSEKIDEMAELKRQEQDIESFLGNDIYHSLQERKLKRQSIIKEEAMKKAYREREEYLNQNRKD